MLAPVQLRELLDYNPITGAIQHKRTKRHYVGDHDGLVMIYCKVTKKPYKMKLDRIAYSLAFGETPSDNKKVLHKNLDVTDNSLKNLALVSRAVFLLIKEAKINLETGIRIQQHSTDQFTYMVYWFDHGVERSKLAHDIIEARKLTLRLQLKYSKVLTKYCVFD